MDRNQYILKSGAILGGTNVAILALLYLNNALFNSGWGNLLLITFIVILYHSLKGYRDKYLDGFISYGKSVAIGVRISMLSGILTGFFYFLLLKVFDPALADLIIAEAEEAYLAMGFSESFVEGNLDALKMSASPWVRFFGEIMNALFFGLILSLIISIFIKRKGDPFQEAMKNVEQQ
jgi:hypothetical protein